MLTNDVKGVHKHCSRTHPEQDVHKHPSSVQVSPEDRSEGEIKDVLPNSSKLFIYSFIWGSLFKLPSSWPPAHVERRVRAAVDDTVSADAGDAGDAGDDGDAADAVDEFQMALSYCV